MTLQVQKVSDVARAENIKAVFGLRLGILKPECEYLGEDAIARGTLLYRLAKWIGHRDPGTLLQHYAHTLGLIHSDVLVPKKGASLVG